MILAPTLFDESYWEGFQFTEEDDEIIYNHLLEAEKPLTSDELLKVSIAKRIHREKIALEQRRTSGGVVYQPKGDYQIGQTLIFPALDWKRGEVIKVRQGKNPDIPEFSVVQVAFPTGRTQEFACNLPQHKLNEPLQTVEDDISPDVDAVLDDYSEDLIAKLEEHLKGNPDFVRIAGRWFPRALLVDVNAGHLNLAEAVLDMAGGGPLPTGAILEQVELKADADPKLVEFSLDLALQEDPRFDEVGPAGKVLWYLQRLEPPEVLEPPLHLRYPGIEYDRSVLTKEMIALEAELDDELSPVQGKFQHLDNVVICLIYPHWRSGTLPLAAKVRHLFPTAYETPRIRFMLVDGESGEKFPGWVVRDKRYVFGLKEWYAKRGVIPGSLIRVQRGKSPGEVILRVESRRSVREWIRTVLVGSDGGVVFAMLKQIVSTSIDERMAIAIPDRDALDSVWTRTQKDQLSLEKTLINTVKELVKLSPQGHVHASELYAAINVTKRCPPAPILSILATHPSFIHVGDLHYRLNDMEEL